MVERKTELDRRCQEGLVFRTVDRAVEKTIVTFGGLQAEVGWAMPDKDAVAAVAAQHGYCHRFDRFRNCYWLNPSIRLEGSSYAVRYVTSLKRLKATWDGTYWRMPHSRRDRLHDILNEKRIPFQEEDSTGLSGEWAIVTIGNVTASQADMAVGRALFWKLQHTGQPWPTCLERFRDPYERVVLMKQMSPYQIRHLLRQLKRTLDTMPAGPPATNHPQQPPNP